MADTVKRAYEFSYDMGSASWEVESPLVLLRVSHPNPGAALVEEASQDRLTLREIDAGLSARYDFFPYTVAGRIEISRERAFVPLKMEFSTPVTMEHEPDGIVRVRDLQGREVLSIIPSRPTDDTGLAGPATEISTVGGATTWELSLVNDGEWLRDESRVFPVHIPLDISFSPPSGVGFASIRAMSLEDETILYRDTRPDSATQFHITLFDDPDFRREKQQYYRGSPACGTVPLGVGDVRDLSPEDLQRYEDGDGYATRTVWLRFIASKPIPPSVAVLYDVKTPGLIDYVGQVAERVGSLDELPIYRGSFLIHKMSPPSYVDGVGFINAYIQEHRVKDLDARITVLGQGKSSLPAIIRVVGNSGTLNLGCTINVYNPAILRCSIIVMPIGGGTTTRGVDTKLATITVHQPMGECGYVYDPCIDFESTWATYWAVAYDDAEHVPAIRSTEYYHEPPYSIGSVIGERIEPGDRTHHLVTYEIDPDNLSGDSWPYQISHRIRTSNVLIDSADKDNINIALWYRHVQLPPPPGTEWYARPRFPTRLAGDDWGDGHNAFIICDTIFEDGLGKTARMRIQATEFDCYYFSVDGDASYDYEWAERVHLGAGSYHEPYYVRGHWTAPFDWLNMATSTRGFLDSTTTRLTSIELHFSGALCYTRSLTYPYEVSEHPRPSSMVYVDHIRLYKWW